MKFVALALTLVACAAPAFAQDSPSAGPSVTIVKVSLSNHTPTEIFDILMPKAAPDVPTTIPEDLTVLAYPLDHSFVVRGPDRSVEAFTHALHFIDVPFIWADGKLRVTLKPHLVEPAELRAAVLALRGGGSAELEQENTLSRPTLRIEGSPEWLMAALRTAFRLDVAAERASKAE